jgi:HMG box factor
MPQKWPFLLKLEVLRSISPPLRPPGPGGPHFETRGPIIAVEGAPTLILKEVAAIIERALSVSADFAVRVWSEDTSTTVAHSSPEPHANSDSGATTNGHAVHENETSNSSKGGDAENSGNTANNNNGLVVQQQRKPSSLISPIASYVARMLKWHKTSEDLIRYITSYPPQTVSGDPSNGRNTPNKSNNNAAPPLTRLPVAILSDGYSLTFSDRYAGALHINDAYRADDHWQWVATLWRGIVGADLTVYVKRAASPDECQGNNCVELAAPGVMVLRVPDGGAAGGGRVDEKLERRLGFEIAEWVRGGSFMAGFGSKA